MSAELQHKQRELGRVRTALEQEGAALVAAAAELQGHKLALAQAGAELKARRGWRFLQFIIFKRLNARWPRPGPRSRRAGVGGL